MNIDLHIAIEPRLAEAMGSSLPRVRDIIAQVHKIVAQHPPRYSHIKEPVKSLKVRIQSAPTSGPNGPDDPDRMDGIIHLTDDGRRAQITMYVRPDKCALDLTHALAHEVAHLFSFPADGVYERFQEQPYAERPSERYADFVAGRMMSCVLASGPCERNALIPTAMLEVLHNPQRKPAAPQPRRQPVAAMAGAVA